MPVRCDHSGCRFECNVWGNLDDVQSICGMIPDVERSVCGCREGLYPVELSGYYWIQ